MMHKYRFHLFVSLPELKAQMSFFIALAQAILRGLIKMEGNIPLLIEMMAKVYKFTEKFYVIFSSTCWPISFKLGTDHPLVKGIQICLNR
jgi:hypothetical protein